MDAPSPSGPPNPQDLDFQPDPDSAWQEQREWEEANSGLSLEQRIEAVRRLAQKQGNSPPSP